MRLTDLIYDPPPLLVVEAAEDGVTAVRRNPSTGAVEARADRELPPGVLDVSPGHPNVQDTEVFEQTIEAVAADLSPLRRPETALLLPDGSSRLTVLEFDALPAKPQERLSLIKFRLAKSVPFEIESARVAYRIEKGRDRKQRALVAVTATEVVRQYERALERLELWPGAVLLSMAAALTLAPAEGMTLFAKLSGHSLTLAALDGGSVRMIRGVDLTAARSAPEDPRRLDDMLADLYPTRVFIEDNLGAPVDRLALCGFGELLQPALERFPRELECDVEPVRAGQGIVGPRDAGIWGYLAA